MIITFATPKGGAGKSTSCAAIGAYLAKRGEEVLIIDLDVETKTLARWGRKTKITGLTVEEVERDQFTQKLSETLAAGKVDHILIDLAGQREVTVLKAIARSDLVVVPAQASEPDIHQALVMISDIKDVAETKGVPIPYRILLTKMSSLRTRVADFSFQELSRKGLPIFRTLMAERTAYREMFLTGVPPAAPHATVAAAEIAALTAEIEEIVKETSTARPQRQNHR